MYQLCVILLKIVRRYCVHCCGDSWHNLWRDLVGDARCYPPPKPDIEPMTPPEITSDLLLEQALKIASLGQLLHSALAVQNVNLYDIEDVQSYLAMQMEWFGELIDQLQIERPLKRRVTKLSALYDKYRHNLPENATTD